MQRVTAAVGTLGLVGLLSWMVAPSGSTRTDVLTSAPEARSAPTTETTAAAEATGPAVAPGATPANAGGTVSRVTGGARTATGCTAPPGTDLGVTASEMSVAVIIVVLSGAMVNSVTGTPSPDDQKANVAAIIADMNAHGGIACRKVVPRFYEGNPLDSTSLQQVCLKVAQDHPFYVVDNGAFFLYPQLTACFADHQLPIYTPGLLPQSTQRAKYPYLFAGAVMEVVDRNTVLALGQRGWFAAGNGFKKLGLLLRSCNAALPGELMSWLATVGVPASNVVKHDSGCPTATAPPSDTQQAVLDFKTSGVTHVLVAEDEIDFPNFTTLAERQGFRPKYAVPSTVIAETYTSQHPDFDNIADAIVINQTRFGEEHTPGMAPSGATLACDAALAAKHLPPTWTTPAGIAGNDCAALTMLKAAAEHAPALARNALAAGLQATGTLDLSYPMGPADFRAPYTTFAGENWRAVQFVPSCTCWRVTDHVFHPSFR